MNFLRAQSLEEREKRAEHAFALALVVALAIVKYVTGLTGDRAPFTLYSLAVAASAARGGFAPALVATLAAALVGGLAAPPGGHPRLLFLLEGLSLALIVSAVRSGLQASESRLAAAGATISELRLRDRHGRVLDAALRHLEDAATETAVVVLNHLGIITEWRGSAERLYGYPAREALGGSATSLFFDAPSSAEWTAMLDEAAATGVVQRPAVHRRRDGGRVHVELELRPVPDGDPNAFTLTVHDLATRREWDDYRDASARAQTALQQAADGTRQQLAALESLTDPSLNPMGGATMVAELLERLRATVAADGVALVQPEGAGAAFVAGRGLQPAAAPVRTERPLLMPGRVALVHNDAARVVQLSGLRWPAKATSLLVVPVVHDGQVRATIEVVSERSRDVTDWDVALVRVVADRLAAVVVQDRGPAAKAS